MALIALTDAGTKAPVYINPTSVVSVLASGKDTQIFTNGRKAKSDGGLNFVVSEPIADVVGLLNAQLGGKK